MPPSRIVTGCLTSRRLVQRWGRNCFFFSSPPLAHFFPLYAYSLGKYLPAPILHTYWTQDGGLIRKCALVHRKYPWTTGYFNTGFIPFFKNKFSELFQDSKIHINPSSPNISMLIPLTVCWTFHIFWTDFLNFPEPAAFFQDFPGFPETIWIL